MLRLNGQAGAAVQAALRHLDEQGEARRVPALLARIRRGEPHGVHPAAAGEPTDASRAWSATWTVTSLAAARATRVPRAAYERLSQP